MADAPARLRVMQSFRAPRSTTNPYITMLDAALGETADIEHLRFDWWNALFGRYDVFHWHWPEGKLHGSTWWKSTGKYTLTSALALRHALSPRIAVVRTVHNIELPEVNAARKWLLVRIDRHTDYRIVLNAATRLPPDQPSTLILHGHYRDWYRQPRAQRIRGRIGTFGGVRRYKGLDSLIAAYSGAVRSEPSLSLRIGGRPSTPALAEDLRQRTAHLPLAELTLEFLSDAELVTLATESDLVALTYRFMHNSGSVLTALSLDRPVLVPRNESNEALADEVGDGWVMMYEDEVDSESLVLAWRAASRVDPASSPDLSRRDWGSAGTAHAAAYRAAVAITRQRGALASEERPT